MIPLHHDDVLFFREVSDAMHRVARDYGLPLGSVTPLQKPKSGMFNRMGECTHDGHIRIVFRCSENGAWEDSPMSPEEVWDTAAHELAHLRYFDHGEEFQEFLIELTQALRPPVDHRTKIIDKILKLQTSREGEAKLGNAEAAESFAAAINRMMLDNELRPSDLDYSRAMDDDPVIQLPVNFGMYNINTAKSRVAWMEKLAGIIAHAHFCRFLVSARSSNITFVGTKSHAVVAEYIFGTMVPAISKMSKYAETAYWKETGCGRGENNKALGYRAAWINGFISRIFERFNEARKAALDASVQAGGSSETGLMRIEQAMTKVKTYMDNKFTRSANALSGRNSYHPAGREAGREAANQIQLGQKGIGASRTSPRKLIS